MEKKKYTIKKIKIKKTRIAAYVLTFIKESIKLVQSNFVCKEAIVMKPYEFNGEKYKEASKHQKEWGNQLIAQLELKGIEDILDLGCGDGVLTEHLAALAERGSVLGIDASAGMIQAAIKLRKDNLEFRQMDINELNFTNRFDIIYSNAALHWIKNHERLINASFAALKPGGRIFWNFAGEGTCTNFFEVIRKKMQQKEYKEYFYRFEWPWFMPSKAEYQKLISQAAFSEAEVAEEHADRYFLDADEMIRWLDQPTIVPFLFCVPDVLKGQFRGEVIKDMLEKSVQPDGSCFETFRRIRVKAVK